ncbi:QcrA and Rieske domain-containing protein [Salegentibacter chungangensis]|uniref:Ubiquinol-cytochrome c reductase iron-sulfur subunit n=1 Tax=Salegentibacter chungangensis TaxID=1335724 RepID=A0ABW3NR80_9FLAO
MKRKQFIKSVGQGVIIACAGGCLTQCSSGDDGGGGGGTNNPPPSGTNVSVSLSSIPNVGDQTTKSGVLFIRITEGDSTSAFIATEALCPHQGGQLVWLEDDEIIECQLHFSQYEPDGDVIRGPQNAAGNTRELKVYSTSISSGNITATTS